MSKILLIQALIVMSLCSRSILYTRHGARSPEVYTEVDKKYLWTIPEETLTEFGFRQFTRLGENYQRKDILDDKGNCIYSKIGFIGSTTQRVLMSNVAFFKALCPNNFGAILHQLFNEYYAPFSTNAKKLQKILASDFVDPFALDFTDFKRPNDFLFHGHQSSTCPALKGLKKELKNTPYYMTIEKQLTKGDAYDQFLNLLREANPSTTIKKATVDDMVQFYDNYLCNHMQGFVFPDPVDQVLNLMETAYRLDFYYVDNSEMLSHQSSLSQQFRWLTSQLLGTQPLSWYSGHGSNLEAMLAVLLPNNPQIITPFGSRIEFVITQDIVNVFLDGRIQRTLLCPQGTDCHLADVLKFLSQYIISDDLLYKNCGL